MTGMAAFVMRSPWHAAGVAAFSALLGVAIPPVAWLSGAVIGLVTVRLGDAGLPRVVVPALVALALVGAAAWGQPLALVAAAAGTWLPAYLVTRVLRHRGRLDDALLVACAVGWATVALLHLLVPDLVGLWRETLERIIQPEERAASTQLYAAQLASAVDKLAPMMTAAVGAAMTLGAIVSGLIAHWWQTVLDAPGAFQGEFHQLRIGQLAAAITAVLGVGVVVMPGLPLKAFAAVAGVVFAVQGLAVVHGVVARRGLTRRWLIGIYVLTVLLPLEMICGLILVGIVDAWADFRRQVSAGPS
jgi:hypothetical protein